MQTAVYLSAHYRIDRLFRRTYPGSSRAKAGAESDSDSCGIDGARGVPEGSRELSTQIVNALVISVLPAEPLPKLDFQKRIPVPRMPPWSWCR